MKKLLVITLTLTSAYALTSNAATPRTIDFPITPGPVMPDVISAETPRTHIPGQGMFPGGPLVPATETLPTPGLDEAQKDARAEVAAAMSDWDIKNKTEKLIKDLKEKFVTFFPEETQAKLKATIEAWKEKLQQSPEKLEEFFDRLRQNTPMQLPENLREKADALTKYLDEQYGEFRNKMN